MTTKDLASAIGTLLIHQRPSSTLLARLAAGRLAAALCDVIIAMPIEDQSALNEAGSELREQIADSLVKQLATKVTTSDSESPSMLRSQGTGLGEVISAREGKRRLNAYVRAMPIEEWAGPVAGPNELKEQFGISRSTLSEWRSRGAVIGLLKGTRKHVYPIAQFVDGRPVEGLDKLTEIVKLPRALWLWLARPHPALDGRTPIDALKSGEIDSVINKAEDNFGAY